MRVLLVVALAACGGAAAPAGPSVVGPTAAAVRPRGRLEVLPPVDPIAALAPVADEPLSWVIPGRIQLEIGGAVIEGPGGTRPMQVAVFAAQGELVRAAVRLEHVRFSAWMPRERLLAVLQHPVQLASGAGGGRGPTVILREGARVRRLERARGLTRVRYVGAFQAEGWVFDDALGDRTTVQPNPHRRPRGRRTQLLSPGATVRADHAWSATPLAVLAHGYLIDLVREVPDVPGEWWEVEYADGEIEFTGFWSRQSPPSQVHRYSDPEVPPPLVASNAKVAAGTCLYSQVEGDAVGYVVGARDVELVEGAPGWWALAIDTPWGPITFAAQGPTAQDLVACGPPPSVP